MGLIPCDFAIADQIKFGNEAPEEPGDELTIHEISSVLGITDTQLRTDALEASADGGVVIFDHRFDDYRQLDVDITAMGGRIVGINCAEPDKT